MQNLNGELNKVEKIAGLNKIMRFLNNPFKYVLAISYRSFFYPILKRGLTVKASTFYHFPMSVSLPAGTDIYLTGGKSDNSEIKLARFIINNLSENDCFIDAGAHYGYFSLLAGMIAGKGGRVLSFEPSKQNYAILLKNTTVYDNISIFNCAVSDTNEGLIFYEFSPLHSEYSTSEIEQFKNKNWFSRHKPLERTVAAITLDEVIHAGQLTPKIIKVDVEGSEYKVVKGGSKYLSENDCLLVLEYLGKSRNNEAHRKASDLLMKLGFSAYLITNEGDLKQVDDIDGFLSANKIESENIVFKKDAQVMYGKIEN